MILHYLVVDSPNEKIQLQTGKWESGQHQFGNRCPYAKVYVHNVLDTVLNFLKFIHA